MFDGRNPAVVGTTDQSASWRESIRVPGERVSASWAEYPRPWRESIRVPGERASASWRESILVPRGPRNELRTPISVDVQLCRQIQSAWRRTCRTQTQLCGEDVCVERGMLRNSLCFSAYIWLSRGRSVWQVCWGLSCSAVVGKNSPCGALDARVDNWIQDNRP